MSQLTRFNIIGALLYAAMLTSLVWVLGGVVQRFVPGWSPGYLVGACLLVALEAAFVQFTLRSGRVWGGEGLRYMIAEIAALAVLMRVVATLGVGVDSLRTDAPTWLRAPLQAFTDPKFVGCMAAGLVVGVLAQRSASDLQDLAPREFEHMPDPESSGVARNVMAGERTLALRRINRGFVMGGALLLLGLGVQAVNLRELGGPSLAIPAWSATAALLYLICGFLLYSQARLALLHSRWLREQMRVEAGVLRRWNRTSVLLIGFTALGALLLPRSYGLGLLDTLRAALGFVAVAFAYIGYGLVWLVTTLALLPMLLLNWLFSGGDAQLPPAPPPPVAPPPVQTTPGEPPLLPSLIFWACVALLGAYACYTVIQRHPGLLRLLTLSGPLAALRRLLGAAWHDTAAWSRLAAERVVALVRRPAVPRPRWPSLRLARLAPRDLVRYFYRSTLQRAARRGVGRRGSQTPFEYSADLTRRLPDLHPDIDALTDSFVAAEYGPRPPTADQTGVARRAWARLRRVLRAPAEQ
jgi:hypothetical protein